MRVVQGERLDKVPGAKPDAKPDAKPGAPGRPHDTSGNPDACGILEAETSKEAKGQGAEEAPASKLSDGGSIEKSAPAPPGVH